MQFIAVLGAFLKSIPAVTELMQKLLDFIRLQQELHAAHVALEQKEKELKQLRDAIEKIKQTGDNTALNDLFNGVKK